MSLSAHLAFTGRCEAAFNFYAELLGGEITLMLAYKDSPMASQVAPEWRDKIVHASMNLRGMVVSGADPLPGTYLAPQGFAMLLSVATIDEAERVFAALAQDGRVQMPLAEQFWTVRFGLLVDRFGIPWEVTCAEVPRH